MTGPQTPVNVLLADDSLLSRELAKAFLEEQGYSYCTAENGLQALGLLEKNRFSIVLLDVEMPELNGYETAKKIREAGLKLPIIAMTGHDAEKERENCERSGIDACITKPFQKEKLHSTMLALLNLLQPEAATGMPAPAASSQPAGNVTDLTHLMTLSKGRKDFFMSMIAIFLEQNTEDMVTLENAMRFADYDTIRLMAHKIGTSISFMGLEKHILPQLKEMEELGEQKTNLARIRKLYWEVSVICEKAEQELVAVQDKEKH